MRVEMLTKEWPPENYGGAGVHVEHLVAQLRELVDVRVQCFGNPRPDASAVQVPDYLSEANPALQTMGVDLTMVTDTQADVDVVHSHTWYANLAGHVAGLLHDIPHVLTAHSLEPFAHGSANNCRRFRGFFVDRATPVISAASAIIAVSEGMRTDILSSLPAGGTRTCARSAQRNRYERLHAQASPQAHASATELIQTDPMHCS